MATQALPAKTFNLAPGNLAAPAVVKGTRTGPAFAMAATQWIEIQQYVENGLTLPTTREQFKKAVGSGAPDDLSKFDDLLTCYSAIHDQCTKWRDNIYPDTVSLASDVYEYGTAKAPVFFRPIPKLADRLSAKPDDKEAVARLKAIIDNLLNDALGRAAKAADVKKRIHDFASQTTQSKITLSGSPADPDAGLVARYNKLIGAESAEVDSCRKTIKAQQVALDADTKEYNEDVTIASTTPTYAWVPFVGWIPAAVVAGIYGKRAVDAMDRINAEKAKIEQMQDTIQADATIIIAINSAETGMTKILDSLNAALPIIEKVEGLWSSIANDLQAVAKDIEQDIQKSIPILMSLGVDEALRAWHDVALAADSYRKNAYVDTTDGSGQQII